MRPRIYSLLLSACFLGVVAARGLEFQNANLRLELSDDGRPVSLRDATGEEMLNLRAPGRGIFMTAPGGSLIALPRVSEAADGVFTAAAVNGATSVTFRVRAAERHLALRIEKAEGLSATPGVALHFELNGADRMRVTELDYMTTVQNESYGVRAHWEDLWRNLPGEPLGGIALFVRRDEADEDETLLRIWSEEKLAHPKIDGAWTPDRARSWLAEWQKIFADRSQMVLEGQNLDELRAALPWAEKARIREIYLFTQTWRTDNFWPGGHGNLHVNTNVFPRGEADLRAFSDEVRAKGMRLNLHYVSGGIGVADPTYVGTRPDRRLAIWVRGELAGATRGTDTEILFRPAAGAVYPPALPHWFAHDHVRIGDEIVRVGAFEPGTNGVWRLRHCRRGQFTTRAADHPAGTEAQGLVVAYGQNYVPDNSSTLLDEMGRNYAELLNRCGIAHAEYDGAEIHAYNGWWGYRKFAQAVYANLDHPATAHDSTGQAPRAHFEYRFNSTRRLLRGNCSFTHGNWSAPVQLASPSRPASTLLDAHFVLSQGHRGGALGLCKPEPMFAVSDRTLRAHGLAGPLIQTLLDWKDLSALLTEEQRAVIDAGFSRPSGDAMPWASRHVVSSHVQTARRTAEGFDLVPMHVMARPAGDIQWHQGQEHGAISPRQYLRPGDELSLHNPFAAQPAIFLLRVLWAFDANGPSEYPPGTPGRPPPPRGDAALFTAGNTGAHTNATLNLVLQPSPDRIRLTAADPLRNAVDAEGAGLRITAENPADSVQWCDPKALPEWGANMDLGGRRGIGLRVTGDGSGALLLFAISGRDYVVPIDFTGARDIVIPNGEAAWASGHWGWRMETKSVDYRRQRSCRLGVARLPAKGRASILVENLQALAEIPTRLENPVIRTGAGSLHVRGVVASGELLTYEGGAFATVFDENWNKLRDLPVELHDYIMPSGSSPVTVLTDTPAPLPWLDVQFIVEGPPMKIPRP